MALVGYLYLFKVEITWAWWGWRLLGPFGRLAQLVEQLTLNQRVKGSSPLSPSNLFNDLRAIHARSVSQKVTFDHMHFHYPLIRINGYV